MYLVSEVCTPFYNGGMNSVWNKPITCKLSLNSKVVKVISIHTFLFINVHLLFLIKMAFLQQSIFHISGSHCLQKKKATWQNVLWSDETK